MAALDIFNQSAFSMVSLTDAINKVPHVPGRIGQLGLFAESGITTTTAMIEEKNGTLSLIPTTTRGGPAAKNQADKRAARAIAVPHIAVEDTIYADQVQNVRAFGSENALAGVQAVVNERLASMAQKMDATLEFHRLGAVKGVVLDADGVSVLYDLFNLFGVVQAAEVAFNLPVTKDGALRTMCAGVKRAMQDELGAMTFDHVHAVVGAQFWDQLIANPEVRASYLSQAEASDLRGDKTRNGTFEFGGITWEEYRGKVGAIEFVATDKAHFFPVGAPGLFKTLFAPADFVETVNTIGLPRYAKQAVDQRFQRFVEVHSQTNPLCFCTRPAVLMKGRAGA